MSPSSSGSWSGACGADIIDLDRYMRGGVRPSRTAAPCADTDCELVVDAGGVKARHKRFSHDSGVSDSSYSRRRRQARPHRRTSTEIARTRPTEPTSTRSLDSSNSLRAFRTVCEQALLEQQRQIAHVAQLCERLTERAEKTKQGDRPERVEIGHEQRDVGSCASEQKDRPCEELAAKVGPWQQQSRDRQAERKPKQASTVDVSELSSSTSRSTKDPGRKDKHRTQQCKTYKIIMSKLDELNRLFSTRSPPGTRAAPPPPRRAPSSSSVSVCDKLVATEGAAEHVGRVMVPSEKPRSVSLASRHVTRAFSVDIAPPPPRSRRLPRVPNVVTESVVKCDSDEDYGSSTGGDPCCGFDLEDPVHLYSQAKRLQTLTATTAGPRDRAALRFPGPPAPDSQGAGGPTPTLCAACRAYWRSLRQCLLPHLFTQSDTLNC